jgi:hypothetical protein
VQGTVNILGIPGIIVPGGFYEDGTPFGVIFMGERWDEADLLGLAFDYEQATLNRGDGPTLIPEPAGLALLATAAGTLMLRRRRHAA